MKSNRRNNIESTSSNSNELFNNSNINIEENTKINDLQIQLEDSKNQIIKLENEKEEISNKYNETQSKTKAFLGFLGL